jgi:hypothetical protein
VFSDLVDRVSSLDDDAVVARFRELEVAARRLEAELAVVVGEVERRKLARVDGHGSVRGWLRARGNWSDQQCTSRVRLAHLVQRDSSVGEALADGVLGVAQAEELAAAAANPRCGRDLEPFLPELLAEARRLSCRDFRRLVGRWETLADVDGAHRVAEATHAARRVTMVTSGGALHLSGFGAAVDGSAMIEIFERFCDAEFLADVAAARDALGDPSAEPTVLPRSDAQRRFDALRAIFEAAASAPPDRVAPEPVVNLNCDIVTFYEHLVRTRIVALLPEGLPKLSLRERRCETTSGVPVTPDDVLRAAVAGHVRRVVYDSDGVVVDMGRKRRLFTGVAAEALRLATPSCAHRGCTVRSRRCQLDHLEEWQDDGTTDQANGAPRCPSHHRAKRRGFRVWRDDDGHWHTYRPDGTEILPV